MPEDPWPVWQEAEPLDQRGPRGFNKLAYLALAVAVGALPVTAAVIFMPVSAVACFAMLSGSMTLTGLIMGINALLQAREKHLDHERAVVATILASISVLGWCYAFVRWLR